MEAVVRVPLLENNLDCCLRPRETQRLMERSVHLSSLGRRLPLPINGRKSARVDRAIRGAIDDLEQVFAEIEIVDEARPAARPRVVRDNAVECDNLLTEPA